MDCEHAREFIIEFLYDELPADSVARASCLMQRLYGI